MATEQTPDLSLMRRYAWLNVGAGFAVLFFMLAIPAVLMPVMYGSIMDDMGWSRGQVTTFASWKFISGAITAMLLGFIVDRFGLKPIVVIGATVTGLSVAGLYFVNTLFVFYLFGFTLGTTAIIAAVGVKILMSRWFANTLGRAVGIAFVGGSFGGVLAPLIGRLLIDTVGWRLTTVIIGVMVWLLVIPVYLLLAREKPEDYGATADMIDGSPGASHEKRGPALKEVLRSKAFWMIFVAHFFVGAIDHSMLEHTALFIEKDANLGKLAAAGGFSLAMLVSIGAKIGFGWLYDRLSMYGIAICWWSLGLGILMAFPVTGVATMTVFVIVRGASHGGVLIDVPCLARHNFGTTSLANLVSFFTAANMLGGAVGTSSVGYAHDALGSYVIPFIVLICLSIAAGLIVASLKPQYWHGSKQAQVGAQQPSAT